MGTPGNSEGNQAGTEAAAPAGWYPDPRGSGKLLYWDGSKWTGDVHEAKASGSGGKTDRGTMAVVGGGVALALAPFLPWVKVILLGNLSLFQLFEAAGHSAGVAWGTVIVGGSAAAIAYSAKKLPTIRRTGLVVGILGGVIALYALLGLRSELEDAQGLATVGIGPYVAFAGCVAMGIGALKARKPRAS